MFKGRPQTESGNEGKLFGPLPSAVRNFCLPQFRHSVKKFSNGTDRRYII